METQLLRWIRKHQKTICAELYQGVQDALHNNTWENSGSAVILPATVTGSPRFMHRKCQDALALCGRFGKPHLFITGTTNPDWPEINAQLQPGQTAHDRPDIANRVFHCKLSQMIKMIENGLFFPTKAQGHSIEWQKWGLTHFHLIVWFVLSPTTQITSEFIDNIISAEIPPEGTLLYDIIKHCNIHGPCGAHNPTSLCMQEGKYKKNPKRISASDHTWRGFLSKLQTTIISQLRSLIHQMDS
jgi:hypothetical protein